MIDNDKVIQFQRVHPLHREFAPGTIDGPYERATLGDWLKVVGLYVAATVGLTAACMGLGYLVGGVL